MGEGPRRFGEPLRLARRMGGEPLELLEPIEDDAQLDRPFHCPWREHQKPTSVRRRHDPRAEHHVVR